LWFQATGQCLAHKDTYSLVGDGAAALDFACAHPRVDDLLGRSAPRAGRWDVNLYRHLHGQRFMRSWLVELRAPRFQCRLALWVISSFEFSGNVAVHPFLSAIILRAPRPTALQIHTIGPATRCSVGKVPSTRGHTQKVAHCRCGSRPAIRGAQRAVQSTL